MEELQKKISSWKDALMDFDKINAEFDELSKMAVGGEKENAINKNIRPYPSPEE